MRLIFVVFIQYEEVWGRGLGLNSMTRSFPTLRLTSSLYILCSFSWYIVRGYIQHFSWEYLKWLKYFFLVSMKTTWVGMLHALDRSLLYDTGPWKDTNRDSVIEQSYETSGLPPQACCPNLMCSNMKKVVVSARLFLPFLLAFPRFPT